MQRKKCKINKPAAPLFFPFLLDGLGSREFVVKTARVYRVKCISVLTLLECAQSVDNVSSSHSPLVE